MSPYRWGAIYRPTRWTADNGPVDLGGDDYHYVFAINESGQIIGTSFLPGTYKRQGTIWSSANSLTGLGVLGQDRESNALGMNNQGAVVGYSGTPHLGDSQRLYLDPGAWHGSLPNLGNERGRGTDINDQGHIVGNSRTTTSTYEHAFWWSGNDGEAPIDLTPSQNYGMAEALNESDLVVGQYDASFKTPFVWNPVDGLTTLNHPGVQAWAKDVNDAGTIVGYYQITGTVNYRACYWPAGSTTAINLNTLLPSDTSWVLHYAYAINDHGAIVGTGELNGEDHAFLLTPVVLQMPVPQLSRETENTFKCSWTHLDEATLHTSGDLESWELFPGTPQRVDDEAFILISSEDLPRYFYLAPTN